MFEESNIAIIRLGLHYSESLVSNSYGNNYHPAFKELCENKIFFDRFIDTASKSKIDKNNFNVCINSKSLSKFLGQKKSNYNAFVEMGYNFEIKFDDTLGKYDIYMI